MRILVPQARQISGKGGPSSTKRAFRMVGTAFTPQGKDVSRHYELLRGDSRHPTDPESHGRERGRAELLYTCEIRVNGRVVCQNSGRRLPMSCPPHEGRLN